MVDLRRYKGRKSCSNWLKLWLKTLATDELATQSVKPVWLHAFCHCPGVTNHSPLSLSCFNASSGDLYTLLAPPFKYTLSNCKGQLVVDAWLWEAKSLKFRYGCLYNSQSDKVIKKLLLRKTTKWKNMIVRHVNKCDRFTGTIQKKMISNKMNIEKK